MYSSIRVFLGDSIPCIEGSNIVHKRGGSAAFELKKLAAKERNERNSVYQSTLVERGEHNFQDHAMTMLEELGVEIHEGGDNVMSVYQSTLVERGEHNFQDTAMIEERNISNSKRQRAKYESGIGNFQCMTEDSIYKRNNNHRRTLLEKALVTWDKKIEEFCNRETLPKNSECNWYRDQKRSGR